MSTMIYAPYRGDFGPNGQRPIVFLAGSIEMGAAEDWQQKLYSNIGSLGNCTFLNPRRKDWDSSWKQEKTHAEFRRQVEWELEALDWCDIIALWLCPGTVSPISLLELGLHLRSGKLIIGCPPGFARKGNVDITAERYGVAVHESWNAFVQAVVQSVRAHPAYRELPYL